MRKLHLGKRYWRPDVALLGGALVICIVIVAVNIGTIGKLREQTIRSVEANLKSHAIVLSEEADRSLRVLDVALLSISERLVRLESDGAGASEGRMTGSAIHQLLKEKKGGLGYVNAIALVSPEGKIVSSSRDEIDKAINVADRDYVRIFKSNPALTNYISEPFRNRISGVWMIALARRISTYSGEFAGLVVGTVTLAHFEDFFRSVALQDGSAIALVRTDGMLLARFPSSDRVGTVIVAANNMGSERMGGTSRIESPIDHRTRIASARPLAGYPLVIVVSQTEEGALRAWREIADHSNIMALVRTLVVLLVALAAARWWRKQRRLTEALSQQNLRFDMALNNMSQGLCFFDGSQRLIVCNNRYLEMYGLSPDQVHAGTTLKEIVDLRFAAGSFPAMSREQYIAWRDTIAVSHEPSDSKVELKDGRVFEIHHRPMPDGGWVATHEDITEKQKLNAQLQENVDLLSERKSLLQAIIDNFPGGIGFFDRDLRVVICNERAKAILDLPERFFANGPPVLEDLLRFNAQRGEYGPGDVEEQCASKLALARDRTTYHFERERPDGTILDVRGIPIDNGGFLTTYMDITERHRSQQKIAHMARHDALTGLANRVELNDRLEHVLTHGNELEAVAILLLDLDRFKAVNDTLGHQVGDRLLRLVADRLQPLVRASDVVARMGGDEFAIVQAGIETRADAISLAERVIDAISSPFNVDGHAVRIGTSIGIAVARTDGSDAETLIKNADLSLYQAKNNGRGTFCFFEQAMDERMQARHQLESDLREALAAQEFKLYYQPMVGLQNNGIRGFEALIRWHHPKKGILTPGNFLALAEETGLIIPVGEWTIREACMTAATWAGELRIAVNLSPAQFRSPGLVALISSALAASNLSPSRLELEINEMALWEDMHAALDILYRLRELGVRIAMDDFGTGHSTLNYLQSFPFDRIKIDRAFVKDIADKTASLAVVRAITALAHGLGMETTVEGVENLEQRAAVGLEGCTEMQGFLVSRALPAAEVGAFVAQYERGDTRSQVAA